MNYQDLFKENNYLKLKSTELVKILKEADKAYHDKGEIILTDLQYDILKDRLKDIAPKNAYFKKVGYKPNDKLKIKLPYYLGSQDKIKYEDYNKKELERWKIKFDNPIEYVISEKLDGISCLIVNNSGDIKIYTRGDGFYGIDITYIKDYIKSIPLKIPEGLAIRGELLLSKKNWEKIKDSGANARNVVAGVINKKEVDKKILPLIDFIVYDLLSERIDNYNALNLVKKLGFKVVKHQLLKEELTNDKLFEFLKNFKSTSDYEIDGIVITHNKKYILKDGENPKYSFAFKSNLLVDEVEVVVTDISWNVSKDKYLKPVVKFNPVNIDGVTIKQATGFNADFIVKNKIGIGSIIKIQRSGGVIPDISEVLKPADNNKPLMPTIPYKWNKTNIDIILIGDDKNREHDIKSFSFFMKSLNIKGVGEGIITKLYDEGYDTIIKIVNITKNEVIAIDGFKEKSSENLIKALSEIKNKTCDELMIASNLLGRGLGEKKLKLILKEFPYICYDKTNALKITKDDLKKINGMGDITSEQFIENLNKFYDFIDELEIKFKKNKDIINNNFNPNFENKYFVFSGFRNKDYEDAIKKNNGIVDDNITKNTNYLIVKNKEKITGKIKIAMEKGIKILTEEEFKKLL